MKDANVNCQSVWQEYQKDLSFKNSMDLFEKTKRHHNFFLGKQWEGLNAPDLEKPVLNFVKRVVNYLMSVLMVNDVAISFSSDEFDDKTLTVLEKDMLQINEETKFKAKLRNIIKNTAIDGDGAIYVRYNPDKKKIESEIVYATNIVMGDNTSSEIENQPYIILVKKMDRASFEKEFDGVKENFDSASEEEQAITVLLRLYKKNGTVHFVQCTQNNMLVDETDTGQREYPVAFMNWENVRGSCHGMGAVETIIPNQIVVNKLWAMALLYQKNNAFPKIFIDKTKLDRWNSSPGAVMGVIGNPNEAIATSFKPQDMASHLMAIVEKTIAYTKDFMGANDAVLGNLSPTNTSAIIALQKSAIAPLELQKMSLYQFVEDYARIVFDIVKTHYGIRDIIIDGDRQYFDYGAIGDNAKLIVNIGPSEYWSETAQIQTMDNLFSKGIIQDAIVYLENIPERVLPGRNKIIQAIRDTANEFEGGEYSEKM